ncbi:MAG TPA: T9SS type A sorting domain-containing protein [Rubricoccaceae bacterium]|jgi:hypothetical protein
MSRFVTTTAALAALLIASAASAQTATVQIVDGAAALDGFDPIELYINQPSTSTTPNAVIEYPNGTPIPISVPANQTISVRARLQNPPPNPAIPRETTVTGTIPEGCFKVTLTGVPPQLVAFFAQNPEGIPTALRQIVAPVPCGAPRLVDVGVFVVNAVTDSPSIRVVERASGRVVASSVAFGSASAPVAFAAGVYTFDVFQASNGQPLRAFTMDLNDEAGQVVQLTYAGFVTPSANQNGPAITLVAVDASGQGEVGTGGVVAGEAAPVSTGLALAAVYPNPTTGLASVSFTTDRAVDVRVTVLDALGREVAVLADGAVGAGTHEAAFDAHRLAPGAYVVRLAAGADVRTGRLTVVR